MTHLKKLVDDFRYLGRRYRERSAAHEGVVKACLTCSANDWDEAADKLEHAILAQENANYMASISPSWLPGESGEN